MVNPEREVVIIGTHCAGPVTQRLGQAAFFPQKRRQVQGRTQEVMAPSNGSEGAGKIAGCLEQPGEQEIAILIIGQQTRRAAELE